MTLIREVLQRDPTEWAIPNLGVAKVGPPRSDQEWSVLRYELDSFVADGEYGDGLQRIFGNYLNHLDEPSQPAVWVSGFFGSGKSHLVRVLDALWVDRAMPDGATARGLVSLPDDVSELLREFDTRQRQYRRSVLRGRHAQRRRVQRGPVDPRGRLRRGWPAAGLRRCTVRALAARAKTSSTPSNGPSSRSGRTLENELSNFYVSGPLAEALLAARPDFATTPAEAHQLLRVQYPSVTTIDEPRFLVSASRKPCARRTTTARSR